MKPKKISKPTKKDKEWQKKIEEQLEAEKINLDHSQGKERFERTIKRAALIKDTTNSEKPKRPSEN